MTQGPRKHRRVFALATGVAAATAVAGCQQTPAEVSLKLLSPAPVSSKDWSTEKDSGSYSSSCSIKGTVIYDVEINPSDFTGQVLTKNAIIEVAGKHKYKDESYYATFIKGKQVSGGVNVYNYAYQSQDDKEEYKALCSVKSLDQVRLLSIGEPIIASPGIKLIIKEAKDQK